MPSRSVRPVPLSQVPAFDHEADVVIAGFRCAGASAAFEAADAGAEVIVRSS